MLDVDVPLIAPGARWYLVHSQPKRESKAEVHLQAQGFRTFVPRFMKTSPPCPAASHDSSADLPRISFCQPRPRARSLGVDTQHGRSLPPDQPARRVSGSRPTGIVEKLLEQSDGRLTRLDLGLVKGQGVRVLSGPFAEFMGKLVRLDATGRVQVLLELMGTAVPVSLHRSALAPAA